MAWLILILAVPFFGFIAFLLFGSTHVEKRRHEKQRRVNDLVRQRTADLPPGDATSGWPAAHASAAVLNRNLGHLARRGGQHRRAPPRLRRATSPQ